jgi:hypothetical protein
MAMAGTHTIIRITTEYHSVTDGFAGFPLEVDRISGLHEWLLSFYSLYENRRQSNYFNIFTKNLLNSILD